MCVKNTHFKCLKSYYRDSRVEVTHLFLECTQDYAGFPTVSQFYIGAKLNIYIRNLRLSSMHR